MRPYGADPDSAGSRRQITIGLLLLLVALTISYLPDQVQERLSSALQATVLRPFLATQEAFIEARDRASRVELLQARVDSLSAILSTRGALAEENRRLRSLLELGDRIGPSYRAASLVRPGTAGSESMFLVSAGARHGVVEGAPVVDWNGLVGVIREVRPGTAVGMDWTHPDFRASAMVAAGTSYGIVENRRGAFREEDRLVLTGGAYHEHVEPGTLVVTSGLGGVLPRGIPVGEVDGVAEVQEQWRKSYWLRPRVEPAAVTHALVQVDAAATSDLTEVFADTLPGAAPDSLSGSAADSLAPAGRGDTLPGSGAGPRGSGP